MMSMITDHSHITILGLWVLRALLSNQLRFAENSYFRLKDSVVIMTRILVEPCMHPTSFCKTQKMPMPVSQSIVFGNPFNLMMSFSGAHEFPHT